MSWKDRSSEHEAVSKGAMFFIAIFIIAVLYAIANMETGVKHTQGIEAAKAREKAKLSDIGNIRYHAERIQEGL